MLQKRRGERSVPYLSILHVYCYGQGKEAQCFDVFGFDLGSLKSLG